MRAAPPTWASTEAVNCCEFDQPFNASTCEGVDVRKISGLLLPPVMDARLLLVVTPILLAASWAVFNIGRAAVGQLQMMLKRANG